MKSTFSFTDSQLYYGPCALARRPAEVYFVMTAFCSDVRQQALFQDNLIVVHGAVDLCVRIEEYKTANVTHSKKVALILAAVLYFAG